jgi:hypothetical protein
MMNDTKLTPNANKLRLGWKQKDNRMWFYYGKNNPANFSKRLGLVLSLISYNKVIERRDFFFYGYTYIYNDKNQDIPEDDREINIQFGSLKDAMIAVETFVDAKAKRKPDTTRRIRPRGYDDHLGETIKDIKFVENSLKKCNNDVPAFEEAIKKLIEARLWLQEYKRIYDSGELWKDKEEDKTGQCTKDTVLLKGLACGVLKVVDPSKNEIK